MVSQLTKLDLTFSLMLIFFQYFSSLNSIMKKNFFDQFAHWAVYFIGSAGAFIGASLLIIIWAAIGAIVSFTRLLALQSKPKGIRVNAGPVATPLTEKTFGEEKEDENKPPLERNVSTEEITLSFLFLVTDAAAQITGQVLHPNGGLIVNG